MTKINHILHPGNAVGRDFVVGDLHGMYDLFEDELEKIGFNKEADRMFCVGDLVDRGEKNMECLALIEKPWFHTVLGNHEQFMIATVLHGEDSLLWEMNGGSWHRGVDQAELNRLVTEVERRAPYAMTIEHQAGRVGICHAQPPTIMWDDVENPDIKSIEAMLWSRSIVYYGEDPRIDGVDLTVHGHTPVKRPFVVGDCVFIDTGAFATQKLTVFEIGDLFAYVAERRAAA